MDDASVSKNCHCGHTETAPPGIRPPAARNADGEPMGHYVPDHDVENAALRPTLRGAPTQDAWLRPLGDLITELVTCQDPQVDDVDTPEHWDSFEIVALRTLSLELKTLALAIYAGDLAPQMPQLEFRGRDLELMTTLLSRRAAATAEIAKKMRVARWGDPRHGGSDDDVQAQLTEDSKRD